MIAAEAGGLQLYSWPALDFGEEAGLVLGDPLMQLSCKGSC